MPVITTRWVALGRGRALTPPPCLGFLEADTKGYYHEAISGLFTPDDAALWAVESSTS